MRANSPSTRLRSRSLLIVRGDEATDLHVALLVSNPNFSPRTLGTPVLTKQIAPSILQALGLDPHALEAVQMEKTPVLPGLFRELSLHLRLLLTR